MKKILVPVDFNPLATAAPHKFPWFVTIATGIGVVLYVELPTLASLATYRLLGLPRGSHLAASVEFFLYETPKVLLLLTAIVFAVGILRSFVTPDRARRMLSGKREGLANVLAALLGVATPFCSCSAVPLFIGFVTAGVPLGVTFSFLIAAPMVNEVAVVLLFGLMGWKITALYLTTGLAIAITAGWMLGRMKLERFVEPWVWQLTGGETQELHTRTWFERFDDGRAAVRDTVVRVWPFIVAGIAIGAAIHGYVPTDALASIMGRDRWWAVPAAVLLGIPMYSNAAGIVPIVQALLGKGAALGTVLAFMMSVIALSLPELIILRKVLRLPLLMAFVAVVAAGILIVGFLFNIVI
jgi:uncharacterized membrane protein YraQ (UPF0718 family)